jgi:hypothetical protein
MSGCGLTAAQSARVSAQNAAERGFRLVGDPCGIEFGQVDPRDGRVVEVRHAVPGSRLRAQRDGTVVGYSVRLKPQVEEHRIRALMTIAVEGNRVDTVIASLRGDPAVGALHSTNGRWDIVAELRADSLASFDQVLGRIRQLEGISSTETSLLLSTFK